MSSEALKCTRDQQEMPTKCIEWKGYTWPSGYGCIKREGRSQRAHRYFYEKKFGKIQKGYVIDHLCRNKSCVNVDHLEAVTMAENTRRGDSAKLTYKDVKEIRSLAKKGVTQSKLAVLFKISPCQISRIINKKRWVS